MQAKTLSTGTLKEQVQATISCINELHRHRRDYSKWLKEISTELEVRGLQAGYAYVEGDPERMVYFYGIKEKENVKRD